MSQLTHFFNNKRTQLFLLLSAAFILLFAMLGANELWTQEARWSTIVLEMLLRHDYLHPYIAGAPYYDKPLLSYWLTIFLSHLTGGVNEWSLRLPSAISGFICVYCVYYLGKHLINREVGLLAGWLLITCYFFIFWSRVASADLLNLAGVLIALSWYFSQRENPTFFSYLIFFIIVAITCLFKGLLGAALIFIAIFPDLLTEKRWKNSFNISFFIALALGIMLYLLPFLISKWHASTHYHDSGLNKVYRENILRFFKPFDHKDPFYTYFIYLPLYLLPWTFLFIPAIYFAIKQWQKMNAGQRWCVWVTLLLFCFFTLSGSRRSYYILPLVPFALLITADRIWILWQKRIWLKRTVITLIVIFYCILFSWFVILQPLANRHDRGIWEFAKTVRTTATAQYPWNEWQLAFIDGDKKAIFYLRPEQLSQIITLNELQQPRFFKNNPKTIIIVIKQKHLVNAGNYLKHYQVVTEKNNQLFANKGKERGLIALIPKKI